MSFESIIIIIPYAFTTYEKEKRERRREREKESAEILQKDTNAIGNFPPRHAHQSGYTRGTTTSFIIRP